MSISMLGDGCRYCQPQEYIDRLHEQAEEEAIPEGYALVPVEPTEAMIDSLYGPWLSRSCDDGRKASYKAMITAAIEEAE